MRRSENFLLVNGSPSRCLAPPKYTGPMTAGAMRRTNPPTTAALAFMSPRSRSVDCHLESASNLPGNGKRAALGTVATMESRQSRPRRDNRPRWCRCRPCCSAHAIGNRALLPNRAFSRIILRFLAASGVILIISSLARLSWAPYRAHRQLTSRGSPTRLSAYRAGVIWLAAVEGRLSPDLADPHGEDGRRAMGAATLPPRSAWSTGSSAPKGELAA